jgi:hypothetical protein
MLGVSERFACRVIGQRRATQRLISKTADDEAALTPILLNWRGSMAAMGTALLHQAGGAALKVPATHSRPPIGWPDGSFVPV